jgi:hypothetical protein
MDTVVSALSRGWVAAMLCVFGIAGMYTAWRSGYIYLTAILGCGALIFYLQTRATDRYNSSKWDAALLAFLALSAAGTLSWALFFNSTQISDFGVYFRCGTTSHHSLQEWLSNCQSAYLNQNITYWLRSFFIRPR